MPKDRGILLLLGGLLSLTIACAHAPGTGRAPLPTPTLATAAAEPTPAASRLPLTLTDSAGRRVFFPTSPRRIVSLSPAHTEILFAIGAGGLVVGTDTYSNFPEPVKALPKVGYSTLDYERILGLNPDLVYAATRQKPFVPELEKLGLRVLYKEEPDNIEGIFAHIALLGEITDHQQQAQELIATMRQRLEAIAERLRDVPQGPRYYYELTPKLHSIGPRSFIGDLLTRLKARNIVTDESKPFPQLSAELVVAADPEVILLAEPPTTESVEGVRSRPGWQGISAVRANRIHFIDADLVSRPGPRIVEGMAILAKLLYPERFDGGR